MGTERAPDVVALGISDVRVRVICSRNLQYKGELVQSSFVVLSFCNQPVGISDKTSRLKTSIQQFVAAKQDIEIVWNEALNLGMFYTMETAIYIR